MDESTGQQEEELQDPPLPLSPEEWKHNFQRLIRRAAISRELPKHSSLNKIIDEVRKYEGKISLDKLATALVDEEVIIHPKMAEVASFVFELLSNKFPELQAVVLLGSAIHGGAMVKEVSGSIKEPDFDWGVITNGAIPDFRAIAMQEEVQKYLPEIISKFGFSESFHLCFYIKPEKIRGISPKSQFQLRELLAKGKPLLSDFSPGFLDQEKTLDAKGTAVFYLSPSFPPEINQRNRQLLFGALKELAQTSRGNWKNVVRDIYEEWQFAHGIRHKHFALADKERDWKIARDVVSNFGVDNLRAKVIWELLKATGK